jgi:hypothetical protein
MGKLDLIKEALTQRKYPDGTKIPKNLPSRYQPSLGHEKCSNCGYYVAGTKHCKKWDAKVKATYWCAKWEPKKEKHGEHHK